MITITSVSSFCTAVQPCLTGKFFDSKVMPRTASSFFHETPKILSNHHHSSHAVELSFKTQTQRSTLIYFTCVIPLYSAQSLFFYFVQFYLYSGIVVLHHAVVSQCQHNNYCSACGVMLLSWKSNTHAISRKFPYHMNEHLLRFGFLF